MLYGFRDGSTVYVTAADNQAQYDTFVEGVGVELGGDAPNVFELMTNPLTSGMDGTFRIEFDSEDEAVEKAAACGIELEAPIRAKEKRIKMQIVAEEENERKDRAENGGANVDHRTIAEIHGLDKNDPWDKRTPEQIEQMEKMKEQMKEAAKNGGVSGESFSPLKKKGDLARVWETKASIDANGNVTINGVLATKGQITMRQSREFVFAVTDDTVEVDDTGFLHTVVAIDFFDNFAATGSYSAGVEAKMNGIIPKALEECYPWDDVEEDREFPNIFTFSGKTPEEVRATMLAKGFREDAAFTAKVAKDTEYDFIDVTTTPDLTLADKDVEVKSWHTAASDEDAVAYVFEAQQDIQSIMDQTIADIGVKDDLYNIGDSTKLVTLDGQFAKEFAHILDDLGVDYSVSPAVPEDDRPLDAPSMVAVIFRLDTNLPLTDAMEVLRNEGINVGSWTMRRGVRVDETGSYFVCAIERFAKQILAKLEEHHSMIDSEIYGINVYGDRIVPKGSQGVTVVDENEEEEIGPRPWNAEASLLPHLSDEEREENEKAIRAKEFVFSGSWNHEKRLTTIYIQPKEYFLQWKDFWNDESLPIKHLLPDHLKEVEPGVYETKSLNYNDLTFDLCKRGFEESNALRLWLNNQ